MPGTRSGLPDASRLTSDVGVRGHAVAEQLHVPPATLHPVPGGSQRLQGRHMLGICGTRAERCSIGGWDVPPSPLSLSRPCPFQGLRAELQLCLGWAAPSRAGTPQMLSWSRPTPTALHPSEPGRIRLLLDTAPGRSVAPGQAFCPVPGHGMGHGAEQEQGQSRITAVCTHGCSTRVSLTLSLSPTLLLPSSSLGPLPWGPAVQRPGQAPCKGHQDRTAGRMGSRTAGRMGGRTAGRTGREEIWPWQGTSSFPETAPGREE